MDSSALFVVGLVVGLMVRPLVFFLLWLWIDMPDYKGFPKQEQTWILFGNIGLLILLFSGLDALGTHVPSVVRYQSSLAIFLGLAVINPAVCYWRWRAMLARERGSK